MTGDAVNLIFIHHQCNQFVLVFRNKEEDESVHIPISNEELINILNRVMMRCEILDLIYPINIMLKEVQP